MRVKEYLVLGALAALWGASFLFIKIAIKEISPLNLVTLRMIFGALGLLLVIPFKPAMLAGWNRRLGAFAIVALFNALIPYLAISWGEEHISSGMAAILNATTPLVVVIISQWWPGGERLTWARLLGVVVGFIGVGILIGPTAFDGQGGALAIWGALAALLGAASYAVGSLLAHQKLAGLPSMQPAIGQTTMGAVLLIPIAGVGLAVQPPTQFPSTWAIAAALTLALGGTTLAYICYYWLIEHVGPTRTLIVTYLLPCMALFYGAVLLHESININSLSGLIFVLLGIYLTGRATNKDNQHPHLSEESAPAEVQFQD